MVHPLAWQSAARAIDGIMAGITVAAPPIHGNDRTRMVRSFAMEEFVGCGTDNAGV
jgi:hypothetical protein